MYPTLRDVAAKGFNFQASKGWLDDSVKNRVMAQDAALITTPNTTVPVSVLEYIDPSIIEVMTAPRTARLLANEKKVGDWTTALYRYPLAEHTGSVGPYQDYGNGPSAGVNVEWNARDQYIFETTITYGDLEVDMTAQAKINMVSQKQRAAAEVIDRAANEFYLLGVSGKRIYGLLNDPDLPAATTPTTLSSAVTWAQKQALGEEGTVGIYNDVLKLFGQLQSQTQGWVKETDNMKLLVSPARAVYLNQTTKYNSSAKTMINTNFPNMEIVVVPELSGLPAGETMFLMVSELNGQPVAELAFGEKLRNGRLIADVSSYRQKFAASTYGCAMRMPMAFAIMTGI